MPTAKLRPNRPTFYPDTSTLVYAFAAARGEGDPGDRAILEMLRRVAAHANLCLSYTHLLELMRGRKHLATDAALLDELEIVWLEEPRRTQVLETQLMLLSAVEGRKQTPPIPACASFASMFETLTPASSPQLLRIRNLRGFLLEGAQDPAQQERLRLMQEAGPRYVIRFIEDRQRAYAEGVTANELNARLDEKLMAGILESALVTCPPKTGPVEA